MARTSALITIGLASTLLLVGCAAPAASTGGADDPAPVPVETTAAPAAGISCPEGFVDAFAAELEPLYEKDLLVTQATEAEYKPDYFVPFVSGGCPLHISGTNLMFGFPVDLYNLVLPDQSRLAEVEAALESAGYVPDGMGGLNYTDETQMVFTGYSLAGESFSGSATVAQFFPDGFLLYG